MAKKTQAADGVAKEATGENKAVVIKEFRDRNDYDTIHKVGDDVSDLSKEVLESLLTRGYIEMTGDLDSTEDLTVVYKAQLDEVLKSASDELKQKAYDLFAKTKFDGPNHFNYFLESVKANIPAQ